MNPITLWRRVMLEPAVFFREMAPESYLKPFLFAVACMLIGMAGTALSQGQPTPDETARGVPPPPGPALLLIAPLGTGLLLFVWAGIIRFFLSVFGVEGDRLLIFQVCGFSTAPYVFNFVPFIGQFFSFGYGLYLTIIGLQETHRLETRQALVAVIIPVALIVLATFMLTVLRFMTIVPPGSL